jgi:hypothetical protein
MYVY